MMSQATLSQETPSQETLSQETLSTATRGTVDNSEKIVGRLKLYFATLSCLGGMVLAAGTDTEVIPAMAIFFAIFGYVFVDWLQIFALPPIAAYAAMGIAALYCISDFSELNEPGNHQMIAVAQLLVFVQSILMLQQKSRRIFEQLGVFCLLQLVVAAVFNHAIFYGLLLIPICVIGAWAMSLLAALSATEGLTVVRSFDSDAEPIRLSPRKQDVSPIICRSPESVESLTTVALRLPKVALLTLTPAVLAVAAIFFYALPRTTDATRISGSGSAVVGFSDELRLEQLGQMGQSNTVALRMRLTRPASGNEYRVFGGLYLRGRVLEKYHSSLRDGRNPGTWTAIHVEPNPETPHLPGEFVFDRGGGGNSSDAVDVTVTCETMRSSALFSIAPFHERRQNSMVLYHPGRWTLSRAESDEFYYPRTSYSFGTHAFRRGQQAKMIPRSPQQRLVTDGTDAQQLAAEEDEGYANAVYTDNVLQYDEDAVPAARRISDRFVAGVGGDRRSDYQIALALEKHLSSANAYRYTLTLDNRPIPGMDPIQQFLTADKEGHCQYFASALTLMLRSQQIPARVVVGYHTDEYNELTHRYVARQLHAHAWVEALISSDQLNSSVIDGQPKTNHYWLRLDPTPGVGRLRQNASGTQQVLDMAQNVWDDYVVDMDAGQQESGFLGGGMQPMNQSYDRMIAWVALKINRLRAGELGGGNLARRTLFSWQTAAITGFLSLVAVLALRIRGLSWWKRRMKVHHGDRIARPSITFYAETLDQLARMDVHRGASQTPEEVRQLAAMKLQHPLIPSIAGPLEYLTAAFYRLRFGQTNRQSGEPLDSETNALETNAPETDEIETYDPIEHARQRSKQVDEALAEITQSIDLMTVDPK